MSLSKRVKRLEKRACTIATPGELPVWPGDITDMSDEELSLWIEQFI